jgi:hypothetical protein
MPKASSARLVVEDLDRSAPALNCCFSSGGRYHRSDRVSICVAFHAKFKCLAPGMRYFGYFRVFSKSSPIGREERGRVADGI